MSDCIWRPQPGPQKALVDCPLSEIFFGGARGGGKTSGVIGKWALKEQRYGKWFNAIMLRRTTTSADDAIEEAKSIYIPLGARFTANPPRFRMPNGGRVLFAYLESTADAEQYQGRNLTDVWVEEAGQYPSPAPIDKLHGALRSKVGVPIQMILTANPGGSGQHWLAERYGLIPLPEKPKVVSRTLPDGTEHRAAVIPSKLEDNQILMQRDPGYVSRLHLVGNKELVRAWLEGDWSAVEGAYFDCWDSHKHVIRPFEIPEHWMRFRSMDWGSAAPFSVGWWAVASEDTTHESGLIPKGAMVRYREWYGASEPNVGLKLTVEQVADGIIERQGGEDKIVKMDYGVADPSMWAEDGGPSLNERMAKKGVYHHKADNKRLGRDGHMGGWDMLRARLMGHERPMIYTFSTCTDSIRTIPVLQHDEKRPEDLDTDSEDHAADEWRYACMSRPWTKAAPQPEPERDGWKLADEDKDSWRIA